MIFSEFHVTAPKPEISTDAAVTPRIETPRHLRKLAPHEEKTGQQALLEAGIAPAPSELALKPDRSSTSDTTSVPQEVSRYPAGRIRRTEGVLRSRDLNIVPLPSPKKALVAIAAARQRIADNAGKSPLISRTSTVPKPSLSADERATVEEFSAQKAVESDLASAPVAKQLVDEESANQELLQYTLSRDDAQLRQLSKSPAVADLSDSDIDTEIGDLDTDTQAAVLAGNVEQVNKNVAKKLALVDEEIRQDEAKQEIEREAALQLQAKETEARRVQAQQARAKDVANREKLERAMLAAEVKANLARAMQLKAVEKVHDAENVRRKEDGLHKISVHRISADSLRTSLDAAISKTRSYHLSSSLQDQARESQAQIENEIKGLTAAVEAY